MSNPVKSILERCKTGFTIGQKLLCTAGALLYLVSPIDVIPDVLIPVGLGDDLFLLYLLCRVWASPTLSGKGQAPASAESLLGPAPRTNGEAAKTFTRAGGAK
jgi:hypothetical protein